MRNWRLARLGARESSHTHTHFFQGHDTQHSRWLLRAKEDPGPDPSAREGRAAGWGVSRLVGGAFIQEYVLVFGVCVFVSRPSGDWFPFAVTATNAA